MGDYMGSMGVDRAGEGELQQSRAEGHAGAHRAHGAAPVHVIFSKNRMICDM